MKRMNKKGVIENLNGFVLSLTVVALVLVVGFLIIAEAKTQVQSTNPCSDTSAVYNATANRCQVNDSSAVTLGSLSNAMNASQDTQSALGEIPGWLGIIVITVIGSLLIGLVSLFRRR